MFLVHSCPWQNLLRAYPDRQTDRHIHTHTAPTHTVCLFVSRFKAGSHCSKFSLLGILPRPFFNPVVSGDPSASASGLLGLQARVKLPGFLNVSYATASKPTTSVTLKKKKFKVFLPINLICYNILPL